jgi:hypothetical protein
VTLAREPLGVLDAWMWAREPRDAEGHRAGILESTRWVEGYERVAELAAELPQTRLVYVADREADIVALMAKARDLGTAADWLIRSRHNRALPEGGKLWNRVSEGEALGEIHFTRHGQKARQVRQQVWAKRVELSDGKGGRLEASCLVAREVDAPQGVKPVEWRLLTNREAASFEAAAELIDWYRARWEIELFFHVARRTPAGWKHCSSAPWNACNGRSRYLWWSPIARLMRLGRTCPELPAELLFEREEWEAAFILNKKRLPKKPPRLNEVVRLIAMLGGFLARKGDGEPGVKTLWQGLTRVLDFAAGLHYARETQAL